MSAAEKLFLNIRTNSDKLRAAELISKLEIEDGHPWQVIAKPFKVLRTERQNNYLWGWLYLNIAKQLAEAGIVINLDDNREIPYDADLLHEIFKEKYLCYDEITRTNPTTKVTSTRKLCYSTSQLVKHSTSPEDEQRCFATYVNNIKAFCFQFWNITIPPTYNEELLDLDLEARDAAYAGGEK